MCFLVIFAFMRLLMFFILLLAFGCQQTTVNGQQTLCTVPVDYYEKQIHIADSLYKNYLPQYNFDEVKAAMEFFDSVQLSAISRQRRGLFDKKDTDENILIAESRLLTAAKAHYYHAVGLTERDDIVGACEHYLTALEIMEEMMAKDKRLKSKAHGSQLEAQSPDYEKIRFIALIYTRLGRLFYNENYCDLAMLKYKRALKYCNIINDTISISYTYKNIGNVYQLLGKADSALYHYEKSLEINSNLTNKLDIEKSIAQILFNKGERDSAYTLIKNNLNKIENYGSKYSYYATLGNMYYVDKEYDSAIFYFNKEFASQDVVADNFVATKLSTIYDSLGSYEMKAYYDNISSELSIITINKDLSNNRLRGIYDEYKERKIEKERLENKKKTKAIAISLSTLVFLAFVITILILRKSKRKDKYIASKEEIISKTNEEIKQKESEIKKLVEVIERHKSDVNSLKNEVVIKEHEISSKESVIKNMEDDLSAKEGELKKLQENIHEYMILINNLNEDNIAKKKQIKSHLEEIENNRQVINDKDRLISIATEGLITRKDAIAENRNEIARLQAIIGENDMIINRMSKDYKTNEEKIVVQLEEIKKLKTEINQAQIEIKDLRFRNSFTEGKIKSQNSELKKKEELIKKYTTEITEFKNQLDIISSDNNNDNTYNPNVGMESYLKSKVCSKIFNEVNELSARNMDANRLTPLRHEEFVMLLNAARLYLNNFNEMTFKHSQLKTDDLYYICLVILGLNDSQISSLFALSYTAINKKKKKIRHLFGLNTNDILYTYIIDSCIMH